MNNNKLNKNTPTTIIIMIIAILFFAGCVYFCFFNPNFGFGKSDTVTETTITQMSNNEITLEQYNKIQLGMTEKEMFDILGNNGTIGAETEISDIKTVVYEYEGKGGTGIATFTVQNGKVAMKTQYGLK